MASEQRGFVFGLTFIVIFSTLLATIPTDLQGMGDTPDMVTPLDPSLVSGFADSENYTKDAYSSGQYVYSLGSRDWIATHNGVVELGLFAKVYIVGVFWLGHTDQCKFISSDGINRGTLLALTEITTDAEDGTHRYSIEYNDIGGSAGSLVVYWNITEYPAIADAWGNDSLYLLHGVGFENTATNNIGNLIVSLLLLQLPNVPLLVNVLLVVPIWASIIYILWFLIKEMIPFV